MSELRNQIIQPACRDGSDKPVYVNTDPTGYMFIAVRHTDITDPAELESDDEWATPGFEPEDCSEKIVLSPEDAVRLAFHLLECAKYVDRQLDLTVITALLAASIEGQHD